MEVEQSRDGGRGRRADDARAAACGRRDVAESGRAGTTLTERTAVLDGLHDGRRDEDGPPRQAETRMNGRRRAGGRTGRAAAPRSYCCCASGRTDGSVTARRGRSGRRPRDGRGGRAPRVGRG